MIYQDLPSTGTPPWELVVDPCPQVVLQKAVISYKSLSHPIYGIITPLKQLFPAIDIII